MKTWTVAAALLFVCSYGVAQTSRDCSESKKILRRPEGGDHRRNLMLKVRVGYTLDVRR